MKTFSVILLSILVSASAYAQRGSTVRTTNDYSSNSRESAATGYLGFGRGALNIGGDFEAMMTNDTGIGGYFMLLTNKKEGNATVRDQIIAFGADAKVHYRPSNWDFYAAPGFGIAMVDDGTNSETTIGPSMRFGVLYALTPKVAFGLEQATFFNWLTSKVAESAETANAAIRINF